MSEKYRKTDDWKRSGENFMIVVNHHAVGKAAELERFDSMGIHRWCIYAYIYPKHWHFGAFDGTEEMFQDAASAMPLHGGPSFLRIHMDATKNEILSYQVGCDYSHYQDDEYTNMKNEHEAFGVFADADRLFNWLNAEIKDES